MKKAAIYLAVISLALLGSGCSDYQTTKIPIVDSSQAAIVNVEPTTQADVAMPKANVPTTPKINVQTTPQANVPVLQEKTPVPQTSIESAPTTYVAPEPTPTRYCCKICSKGKACGDTCISRSYTCHKGPGCACDAN